MNYYNEFDPKAAAWLRELIARDLIPKGEVDERSILDVAPRDLAGFTQCHFFAGIGGWSLALSLAGWPADHPVWTGSCPCQPFSGAGKGEGFADERHLWPYFHWLIEQQHPPVVFGEQVASPAGLKWLDLVQSDLEGSRYSFGKADLCAACVGASQIRPRLWWVADANYPRREGTVWPREPNQARKEWPSSRGESLRSAGGYWPPGPGEVGRIPVLANGLPGVMGRCRGYGNAIVPEVAAEFIGAFLDCEKDQLV